MGGWKRISSFWRTLAGVLTGLAATITAVGTLLAVLPQLAGQASGGPMPPAATAAETASPATPANLCDWLKTIRTPHAEIDPAIQKRYDDAVRSLGRLGTSGANDSLAGLRAAVRRGDPVAIRAEIERLRQSRSPVSRLLATACGARAD